MQLEFESLRKLYTDNVAMKNFVKGEGIAKGVRHMELRMWYTREVYKQGDIELTYMSGKEIPANLLTKLGTANQHREFVSDIMGLQLLND